MKHYFWFFLCILLVAWTPIDVRVASMFTISGVVVDTYSQRIEGATVRLWKATAGDNDYLEKITDKQGRFSFSVSATAGRLELLAIKPGHVFLGAILDELATPDNGGPSPRGGARFWIAIAGTYAGFELRMSNETLPSKTPTITRTITPTVTRTSTVFYPTITATPKITPTELYPPVVGTNTPTPTPFVAFFADPWAEPAVYADYYITLPIKWDNPRVAAFAIIARQEGLGAPTTLLNGFTLVFPDGEEATIFWMEFWDKYILWARSDMPNAIHIMDTYGYSMYEQNQLGEGE